MQAPRIRLTSGADMTKDIFDLTDTSDLPGFHVTKKAGTRTQRVVEIFSLAGRPLTRNEFHAGWLRHFQDGISANAINIALHQAQKSGHIKHIGLATFALPEHANVTPIKRA
jgi:hypothetical protein